MTNEERALLLSVARALLWMGFRSLLTEDHRPSVVDFLRDIKAVDPSFTLPEALQKFVEE